MNVRISAAIVMLAAVGAVAAWAQGATTALSPAALKQIAEVEVQIDRIETE
jgi:hypothetical protein